MNAIVMGLVTQRPHTVLRTNGTTHKEIGELPHAAGRRSTAPSHSLPRSCPRTIQMLFGAGHGHIHQAAFFTQIFSRTRNDSLSGSSNDRGADRQTL